MLFSTPLFALLASASLSTASVVPSRRDPGDSQPADGKNVVAHFMVGNSFPYTPKDWSDDVKLASSKNIDAFALNTGIDDWQPNQIDNAYAAAAQSGTNFKVFLSLDMTSLPCGSGADAARLRGLVNRNLNKPAQFKRDGKAFVSTFDGAGCTFGHGSPQEGWAAEFTQHPDLAGKIHFVPAFFIDPQTFGSFSAVMNGAFAWDSGWPKSVTSDFAHQQLNNDGAEVSKLSINVVNKALAGTSASAVVQKLQDSLKNMLSPIQKAVSRFIGDTDLDTQFLKGLDILAGAKRETGKHTYMGAVAANFFTHYGKDSFNKNWSFLGDQHLLAKRWENVINQRNQYDIIQLLTWNDFGESHYLGPIKGAQPNSQAWTTGFDHTAFLDVVAYYAQAFKTGQYADIKQDRLIAYARPHVAMADAPDPIGPPTNRDLFQDAVWVLAFASSPSKVTLQTADNNVKTFDVPKGVTKLAIPIAAGGYIKGTLERNGQQLVQVAPKFNFDGAPKAYNFNYFVAGASAAAPAAPAPAAPAPDAPAPDAAPAPAPAPLVPRSLPSPSGASLLASLAKRN